MKGSNYQMPLASAEGWMKLPDTLKVRCRRTPGMPTTSHVYLIPGFFGFANLGELVYFSHVAELLTASCADLGLEIEVHPVDTPPTSSLPCRAALLLDTIQRTSGQDDPIYLVGHSTGGLDARILAAPGVQLPGGGGAEEVAARVQTVVTVATPHHGTPVAGFFTSLMGRQLLRALSLATIYVLRFGSLPLSSVLRLGAMAARLDDRLGLRNTVLDQLFNQLLGEFSPERRDDLRDFLDQVNNDQALLTQLSTASMDLFDALARDRAGIRQGCVVARVRPQGLDALIRVGANPYGQATHAIFTALHSICAGQDEELFPSLDREQSTALEQAYGDLPSSEDSDGIVPTLSQVRGEVIHAAWADHLDVVGHFKAPDHDPPHYDWLSSASDFRREDFEQLWTGVATFIAG